MASSVRIDGCLPGITGPAVGIILSRGWFVEYNWSADRTVVGGQPKKLSALSFPAPFDADLEGVLRGRDRFSDFIYLFKSGQYLKLRATTMLAEGPARATASAWHLPPNWTTLDAVFPGSGKKSGFCYFFRGDEYCRFDWSTDNISPGYPKRIGSEWKTPSPFDRDLDGVIVGQDRFSTKAYLFKSISAVVNRDGHAVASGTPNSFNVTIPSYIRYDFDTEKAEDSVQISENVVGNWPGLMPLLDTGPAIDVAVQWCNQALGVLAVPHTAAVTTALSHHFRTPTLTATQLSTLSSRLTAARDYLTSIPSQFQWTSGLAFAAQTTPGTLLEIGDKFSLFHGPNGRAAVLIHEAIHFTHPGGPAVDIPEWSGETVNGVAFGIDSISGRAYNTLTPDEALTNPSSYVAIAQEIGVPGDSRFGAGRPQE